MKLTTITLRKLAQVVAHTHNEEIGCDECWDHLDQFAELMLNGKTAAEFLPLVEEHLIVCGECRDEFEAFLSALRAIENEPPPFQARTAPDWRVPADRAAPRAGGNYRRQ